MKFDFVSYFNRSEAYGGFTGKQISAIIFGSTFGGAALILGVSWLVAYAIYH